MLTPPPRALTIRYPAIHMQAHSAWISEARAGRRDIALTSTRATNRR